MSRLQFLDAALDELAQRHLLRLPQTRADLPAGAVWLCSNDYLGFAGHALGAEGAAGGSGASSLVWGHGPAHAEAEAALASYTGVEACLLFSSGYAANVGVMAALAGRGDLIVSDALNHASIIDGCRLSGANVVVVPHLDIDAMARALKSGARRRFVVTESYFSMDGDGPDLAGLAAVCRAADAALIVDEAHALGVFGPGGRGRCAEAGVVPDVLVGTLGKSFGLAGAFAGGSRSLRTWLWNRARSFVFSTAPSPALAGAIAPRVAEVAKADRLRQHLLSLADRLRERLADGLGARPGGFGPIVPLRLGAPDQALACARRLLDDGFVVQPMRPPTVPPGSSRLRLTVHSGLHVGDVDRAAKAIVAAVTAAQGLGARAVATSRGASPVTVAVVGTGTEIGKTYVGSALVQHLVGLGVAVAGRKPIESGVSGVMGDDQRLLEVEGSVTPRSAAPFRFAEPISPHLAARREGRAIDLGSAIAWCREGDADVLLVESAGGLLSPLDATRTNLDLLELLAPSAVLLVCSDRLGVLHDVAACRLALQSRALWSRTVVCVNGARQADASSGTNEEELRRLLDVPVVGWGRAHLEAETVARTWGLIASVAERFT